MHLIRSAFMAIAVGAFTVVAFAQHDHAGDVFLGVQEGRIVTGYLHHGTPDFPKRVFGAEFGEDPNLPANVVEAPGFDSRPGTFNPHSAIGFNFLGQLLQWDGAGFVPSTLSMTFQKAVGGDTLSRTTSTHFVRGFTLDVESTGPDAGEWHEHYAMILNPAQGATDPAVGVYALRLSLFSTDSALLPTREFWFVFNYQDTEQNHDTAIAFAEAVVPEPATLLALAAGIGLVSIRRRRKS